MTTAYTTAVLLLWVSSSQNINAHSTFYTIVVILPGLQDERDQTACEPISLTVPVLSNCFGSAPGGVLFGVVISSERKQVS